MHESLIRFHLSTLKRWLQLTGAIAPKVRQIAQIGFNHRCLSKLQISGGCQCLTVFPFTCSQGQLHPLDVKFITTVSVNTVWSALGFTELISRWSAWQCVLSRLERKKKKLHTEHFHFQVEFCFIFFKYLIWQIIYLFIFIIKQLPMECEPVIKTDLSHVFIPCYCFCY